MYVWWYLYCIYFLNNASVHCYVYMPTPGYIHLLTHIPTMLLIDIDWSS